MQVASRGNCLSAHPRRKKLVESFCIALHMRWKET